ncbi:MAG: efflux RND transporter permease subunit [Boseongicola sp.]|nr:efflux RND transporter permease subunit [Boseongicola sp.]
MTDASSTSAGPTAKPGPIGLGSGPIAYFAGNPVAAYLLMILLIVGGVLSGLQLTVQYYPDFEARRAFVSVLYPGASTKEIEEDVNRRIEEAVFGLPGVERVVSTASQGIGNVTVEMATFADSDTVVNDIQSAVDGIENFPPARAEQPDVQLLKVTHEVMTLAVMSSSLSEDELRLAAEDLRDSVSELPAVSQVFLKGTRDREITIELSEEELRRHGLSIGQVSRSVRQSSLNLTMGELRTDTGGVVLQTVAKGSVGQDFEDIPLITRVDGTIVTLGDIATIRDGFVDEDILTEVNSHPAVLVRIDANERQSVVDMAEDIRSLLASYEAPETVRVAIWNDNASPIFARLREIVKSGMIGTILVFVCLVLVFDLRIAFWMTVGIPLSFVGSLLFFEAADLTLNLGTIFGFFLLVGLVVDDSVVVGESIASEREKRTNALDAAIAGARAMVGPLTISATTTILAFLPFLFITSPAFQIVNVFPYVAIFVLLVSLVAAFFILPAHLAHESRWSLSPLSDAQSRVGGWLDEVRDLVVAPAAAWSLRNVWLSIVGALLILVFAVLLLGSNAVRIVLFDENLSSTDNVQADIYLPVGSPFEETVAAADRFVEAAHSINDRFDGTTVDAVSIIVGNVDTGWQVRERLNSSNLASVRLHLSDQAVRSASPPEVERAWREAVGRVTNLENVEFRSGRIAPRPSISYSLKHDDLETLRSATADLRAGMATVPGIYGIHDDLAPGKRHLEFELTPAGEAAGLTPALIGKQLRSSFHGADVQRIQRGREEINVVVRYPAEQRRSLGDLARERLQRPGGGEIPLSLATTMTESREPATLTRIDGRRAARVSGRADAAVVTPIQARRQVREQVIPDLLTKYPGLAVEVEAGARDEGDMLETLAVLVPIVLIAIFALIASFLRSYWKPVIATVGIPIAFAGAIISHWILGWDLTTMSIFGMIAVSGVVVNDTLVLLDRYNTIRRDNVMVPAIAAAAAATRQRFRPVFLTTLTTLLGLSPLLYERGDELIAFVPFVVSMLGGLAFSTLSVLFVLPALVMIAAGRSD